MLSSMNPILEWRVSLRMSQEVFAAHLTGMRGSLFTQPQVSNWENWGGISKSTLLWFEQHSGGFVTVKKYRARQEKREQELAS